MPRQSNGKFTRAAVLLTAAAILATAVSFTVRAEMTANSAAEECGDHEIRLRTMERTMAEMAADIRVIRQIMEHEMQRKEKPR